MISLQPAAGDGQFEPRSHRLQRQDAKSRKTFKIKRHRSTIKGNIIRSATVKECLRVRNQGATSSRDPIMRQSADRLERLEHLERLETQPEEDDDGSKTVAENKDLEKDDALSEEPRFVKVRP